MKYTWTWETLPVHWETLHSQALCPEFPVCSVFRADGADWLLGAAHEWDGVHSSPGSHGVGDETQDPFRLSSVNLRAALTMTYILQRTPLQPCVTPSTPHRANACPFCFGFFFLRFVSLLRMFGYVQAWVQKGALGLQKRVLGPPWSWSYKRLWAA